jgi:hypothetical protein
MTPAEALALIKSDVATGDAARAAGNWALAVQRYQLAGAAGANTVGPAIDAAAKGSVSTTSLTGQAWDMNGLLAELNATPTATVDDANQASQFAQQMLAWYTAAVGYANALKAAPAGAPSIATAETNIIVPTAKTLPSQMQHTPTALQRVEQALHLPPMSGSAWAVTGGTGALGFVLGRAVGIMFGGPLGLVLGVFAGYEASKRLKL